MHIKLYLSKRGKGNWELHTKISDEKTMLKCYKVIRKIDNFTKISWEPRKEI